MSAHNLGAAKFRLLCSDYKNVMYIIFYSLKHFLHDHITFQFIFSLFLIYPFQVLLVTKLLRLTHTIIRWSFEFLDVVMEKT